MAEDNIKVINDLLDRIKVTDENRETIERIRMYLEQRKYQEALAELQVLQASGNVEYLDFSEVKEKEKKIKERKKEEEIGFPKELASTELEKAYIGLLLNENGDVIDFSKIQLETINTYAFNETLDVINDSDLLYDCVPNIISYFFDNIETSSTTARSIESIIKDTIDMSNPYYVYYVVTNYNRHYEEESDINEIDNLCILLENIKTLLNSNADVTSENILSVMQNNKNLKTFNDILIDLNSSYIFHRGGPKKIPGKDETTFMSIIESIIDNESISQVRM